MDLNIHSVAYLWAAGVLLVLVTVVAFVVVEAIRERNRRREEAKAYSQSLNTWDVESPSSFGHR